MASAGVNRAITQDGEKYNKLKRPHDLLTSATAQSPPQRETVPQLTPTRAISEAHDDIANEEEPQSKRLRAANEASSPGSTPKLYVQAQDRKRSNRAPLNMDYGMQSMFPGMLDEGDVSDESTDEALAYLRRVR
jgi:hypothetical protein